MVKPLFFLGRTEVSPMRVFRCLRTRLCVQQRCMDVIPTCMLYAGERCWSPVCNSDNVQCDSGKFNNLASIGWKIDMLFMVDAFHSHDQCNSGNLNSANLFRCNAGKFNNAILFQWMTSMAEAATRAAMGAEKALRSPVFFRWGKLNWGLQAASRILKPPDTYNGEDVMLSSSGNTSSQVGFVLESLMFCLYLKRRVQLQLTRWEHTVFPKDKSALESILSCEQLVHEYMSKRVAAHIRKN